MRPRGNFKPGPSFKRTDAMRARLNRLKLPSYAHLPAVRSADSLVRSIQCRRLPMNRLAEKWGQKNLRPCFCPHFSVCLWESPNGRLLGANRAMFEADALANLVEQFLFRIGNNAFPPHWGNRSHFSLCFSQSRPPVGRRICCPRMNARVISTMPQKKAHNR